MGVNERERMPIPMSGKTIELNFKGYWRAQNVGGLPDGPGVYCVYTCVYNARPKTVTLKNLIYIGHSDNIQERVIYHQQWGEWERQLEWGETLCFSAAVIHDELDRELAEAALIYQHKPSCNTIYRQLFPFDSATVHTKGNNSKLSSNFTVRRTSY